MIALLPFLALGAGVIVLGAVGLIDKAIRTLAGGTK